MLETLRKFDADIEWTEAEIEWTEAEIAKLEAR